MTPREVPPYPQSGGPTLIEVLDRLGYATRPARWQGKKDILRDGEAVFTGAAHEVWAWLRETGQYQGD